MTVISLFLFVLFGGLFVGGPIAMWRKTLRVAFDAWLPRPVGVEHVGVGTFRETDLRRLAAEGPPGVVHAAAIGCWILGVAFVPGLLAGLIGLVAGGVGLVSIPGLVLAWKLFFLGAPLLRGDADAAERATDAAVFARMLNYVVLGLCAVAATLVGLEFSKRGQWSGDLPGTLGLTLSIAFYACVSLVHARLLVRAAEAIDAEQARRHALTGVRADATDSPDAMAEELPVAEAAPQRRQGSS
jgi:hypothetical protein